jgi:large subunit ribosomal protein L25
LVREVQRNPITRRLLHVDFYQVSMEEKVEVEVPIVLVGQAPAMTIKDNTLLQALNTMTVECLPAKIPANIEVDISPLTEAGKSIRVKDITVNPDITVLTDPEQVVVIVTAARAEEVVAPPEAVAAPTEEVKKVEEKEKEKPEEA